MQKVFIVHGFGANPNGGWRPWLMSKLAEQDIYACALSMPSPAEPKLLEWLEELKHYVERNENNEIYLVGHSLGGTLLLRYFEKYNNPKVKGAVFVSAPCMETSSGRRDLFLSGEIDFKTIKQRLSKAVVIHGDDDPVVPFLHGEHIAKELDAKLLVIPNGKHLNGSAGFTQLPECLNVLLEMMK